MNDFKPRRSWRWLSLLFAAWLGLSAVSVSAQEKEVKVSGQVLDAKNEPVVGAAVYVEGTSKGTTTDVNGNFTLLVKPGAVDASLTTTEKILRVRAVYDRLGIARLTREAIARHTAAAIEALDALRLPEERTAPLHTLATGLLERAK